LENIVKSFLNYLQNIDAVLIVPHWDADGIASASILLNILDNYKLNTYISIPKLGFYEYKAINKNDVSAYSPDTIILVDYALSIGEIRNLEREYDINVCVIDHHVNSLPREVRYVNPYVHGLSLSDYPSNTWLLHKHFDVPLNLQVLLGYFCDLGPKYKIFREWFNINKFIRKKHWCINDLIEAKNIINSCYQLNNPDAIKEVIHWLRNVEKLSDVILNHDLRSNYSLVSKEIERIINSISPVEEGSNYRVYKIRSKYLITSDIGKFLAAKNMGYITIVISEVINGPKSIYVRSYDYNLSKSILKLKGLGYNVGGKENVFSIQLSSFSQKVLDDVINSLEEAVEK